MASDEDGPDCGWWWGGVQGDACLVGFAQQKGALDVELHEVGRNQRQAVPPVVAVAAAAVVECSTTEAVAGRPARAAERVGYGNGA